MKAACLFVTLFLWAGDATAQAAGTACTIRVGGDVPQPLTIDSAALGSLPTRSVVASDHGQKSARYEGVRLGDVLGLAKVQLGRQLRGEAVAQYVVVSAADGYRVVFALPELDPEFSGREVLLVTRKDGGPLGAKEAPCRIVVPDEKRHGRWIRQVTSVEVHKLPRGGA